VENADVNRILELPGSTACTIVSGQKQFQGLNSGDFLFRVHFGLWGEGSVQAEEAAASKVLTGRSQCTSIITPEFASQGQAALGTLLGRDRLVRVSRAHVNEQRTWRCLLGASWSDTAQIY